MSIGVDSPACREGNEVSSKLGAQIIFRGLLGLTIDLDAMPDIDPGSAPETVIEAESVQAIDGVEVEVYD
jgi:DEAD/DEAH box helicase domain-containing protein